MARRYSADWQECYKDVDIVNGGVFLKDYGDYADVLEVIELGSASGAEGRVLVEVGSVGLYTRSTSEAVSRLRQALISCGPGIEAWRQMDRTERRLSAWESLWAYGGRDMDSETVLQVEDMPEDGLEYGFAPDEDIREDERNSTEVLTSWLWANHNLDVNDARGGAA